jgi:hypothetical protein
VLIARRAAADRGQRREAAGAIAEVVIRSVELIVQPGAKDAVGEMGVRGDRPGSHTGGEPHSTSDGATRTCRVERAKVHVKALYFPSPVTITQPPLR